MGRGNTSKNVIWAAGVATCQCRCGWQRSIISGDSYRVKRLQSMCIKQHKKICEMAEADNAQPPSDYNSKVINRKTKEQLDAKKVVQNMYKAQEKIWEQKKNDTEMDEKENVNK